MSAAVCYIAGPMTGLPGFNYEAFDTARDELTAAGWDVISPADLDRENIGLDFSEMTGTEDLSEHVTTFARQDIAALLKVHAVFVLDGWESSTGTRNELTIAAMLGVPIFLHATGDRIEWAGRFSNTPAVAPAPAPVLERTEIAQRGFESAVARTTAGPDPELERLLDEEEEIARRGAVKRGDVPSVRRGLLTEAADLVDGDRNAQYGDPRQDFQRTASMWTSYLDGKTHIEPHDVAAMMALLKLSRIRWSPEKRDSWVDLAGYAACGFHCVADDD